MLVRKFLRQKITPEAQGILKKIEDIKISKFVVRTFTKEELDLIVKSLYQTERIWEQEK